MPEAANLAKAELRQLDANFKETIKPDTWCKVQFNPETLKVSFANQIQQPSGQGDQRGKAAAQFVGAGTTKLTLSLWFDVGSPPNTPQSVDAGRLIVELQVAPSRPLAFLTVRLVRTGEGALQVEAR